MSSEGGSEGGVRRLGQDSEPEGKEVGGRQGGVRGGVTIRRPS